MATRLPKMVWLTTSPRAVVRRSLAKAEAGHHFVFGEHPMATQKDFTADEWKNVTAAPFLAGMIVTMADLSGLIGITKEAAAVGKVIRDSASTSPSELIRALGESFKSGARPEM